MTGIQYEIERKNSYCPYYATTSTTRESITDMDHFPFTRFYRGVYNNPDPIVFEREAGYRKRDDRCYNDKIICQSNPPVYPNHCFQGASLTVHPCYPEYMRKDSDKQMMDLELTRAVIPMRR